MGLIPGCHIMWEEYLILAAPHTHMYGKHMKMSERLAEVAKISPSCCLYDKIYDAVFLPLYRAKYISMDAIH